MMSNINTYCFTAELMVHPVQNMHWNVSITHSSQMLYLLPEIATVLSGIEQLIQVVELVRM